MSEASASLHIPDDDKVKTTDVMPEICRICEHKQHVQMSTQASVSETLTWTLYSGVKTAPETEQKSRKGNLLQTKYSN